MQHESKELSTMKLKSLLIIIAILACVSGFTACNSGSSSENSAATAVSVDSLMNYIASLTGDTVEVEGLCSHICRHGGRKAFLQGIDSTLMLRCEATAEMGGAFAPDCPGKTLIVKGIVCENRIGEAELVQMEAAQAKADSAVQAHQACATEKKAQGQDSCSTFEARMADYRAKIEARKAAEGKDYLSYYYLEALSYSIDSTKTTAE